METEGEGLERLEREAESLRARSAAHLEDVVAASFDAIRDGDISEQAILDDLAEEITVFFQTSADEVSRDLGLHVADTLRPHQQRADDLIQLIRKAAAAVFDIPYRAPDSSAAFEMKRRPLWVLRKQVPSLLVVLPEGGFDSLLPASVPNLQTEKAAVQAD